MAKKLSENCPNPLFFSGFRGGEWRSRIVSKRKPTPVLKLGDRVRILHSTGQQGRIVELRGSLGPGGAQIYRVRVRRDPKPAYIELREDQLVAIYAEE